MNRLKELRIENNSSGREISEKIGISMSHCYQLEKSVKRLNDELLIKFAGFYNVSTDYILGLTDEKHIYIMKNLPAELTNVGLKELKVTKELMDRGLSAEDILKIVDAVSPLMLNKKR